jgi:CubicO group peptidase (beta-lactamase class C family)
MAIAVEAREHVNAAPEEVSMSSARLRHVTRLVHGYVDSGKLPGTITLVARRGKVVYFDTYGHMDDEAGKAMRPDTIFRIYSMTKPIVSVALMTLYEEGAFQLDDPAAKFIPELGDLQVLASGTAESYQTREPARAMTVRDLLMHTSGLMSMPAAAAGASAAPVATLYERAALRGANADGTLAEMIAKLGQLPLHCDPGSTWIYGISTDVVGYLCEVLSGQSLDRFLEERIFGPLHMPDTGFTVRASELDRFAANYRRGDTGHPPYVPIDRPATSAYAQPRRYLSGSGGLVSTAADYLRFCQMLVNGGALDGTRILGPRTLRLMTGNHLPGGRDLQQMARPGDPAGRPGIGFGLGFAVLLDPAAAQRVGTAGEYYWGGAASTAFWVTPAEDLVVIFLTQLMPSSSYPISRELRATVYQAITD